jgi:geranylgeranyl diphosphate synthase type I
MLSEALPHPAVGATGEAPALLGRYQPLIRSCLRATAPSATSLLGRMAGYQMGWVDRHGRACEPAMGKLVRPSLCLWACEACGGDVHAALPAAAALEWIHNFTLVHDDIQDGDRTRRNRETVWSVWGAAQGINAGDALHALAYAALASARHQPARALRATRVIAAATLEVIEGQCADLELEGKPDAMPREYARMIRMKTGALLGAALEAGAIMAGARAPTRRRLRTAGRLLGMAFQTRDDWLGMWGDPAVTGKSRASDVSRRKVTYPVVAAFAALPVSRRERLRELFQSRAPGVDHEIRALLDEAGGAERTRRTPARLAERAIVAVRGCGLDGRFIDDFTEVARYVANRSR